MKEKVNDREVDEMSGKNPIHAFYIEVGFIHIDMTLLLDCTSAL